MTRRSRGSLPREYYGDPGERGPFSITVSPATLTPVANRRWYFALACSSATPTILGDLWWVYPGDVLQVVVVPASVVADFYDDSATEGPLMLFGMV